MDKALYQLHTAYGKHPGQMETNMYAEIAGKRAGDGCSGTMYYCPSCGGFYVLSWLDEVQYEIAAKDTDLPPIPGDPWEKKWAEFLKERCLWT